MEKLLRKILMRTTQALLILLLITPLIMIPATAPAATTNPSPASPGYMVLPVTFSRTVAAESTVTIARLKLPFPARVISASASCETADYASTDEAYTIDIQEAGTTILSSEIDLAAADTVYDGTVSDTTLADEAVVTVLLDVSGTTPSVSDVTVLLVLKRL